MPSSHLILCRPLLLLPSIFPSIRVFSYELAICYKEQYRIGTWNVRSMNQGKLEVVKQEMERVNIDNLGITKLKWNGVGEFNSVQFSSVAQSCPTLYDPMNRSTPGLPVHHHLPEFTQTHVHRVRDAIQPSHPRSSPSSPAPNPSQHQSLFQ